jgi:transcriptional regulator with XRE-family HTH domain
MKDKEIGENIKIYRNRRDLTQQELAEKVGVTWEMISRYERGASSALKKIDSISKALAVDTRELLEPYKENSNSVRRLPLFVSIPKDFVFTKENAKYYYPCPDWIYELDSNCFAVDSDIIYNKTFEIKNNGVIYVVGNDLSKSNLYLSKEDSRLIISKDYSDDVIGGVVAEEVRLLG